MTTTALLREIIIGDYWTEENIKNTVRVPRWEWKSFEKTGPEREFGRLRENPQATETGRDRDERSVGGLAAHVSERTRLEVNNNKKKKTVK